MNRLRIAGSCMFPPTINNAPFAGPTLCAVAGVAAVIKSASAPINKIRGFIGPPFLSARPHLKRSLDSRLCYGQVVPSSRGGVAAPLSKCHEATEAAQTGWSLTPYTLSVSDHPVRSFKGGFATFLLMSRPPLLTRRGMLLLRYDLPC